MVDDKLFQFLNTRLQSRTSVSLSFQTIASSASLVLLALFFDNDFTLPEGIVVLGILFPICAMAYVEITYFTIHRNDHKWIRKIIAEETKYDKGKSRNHKETEKILVFTKGRSIRFYFLRFIMILPVLGWYFVLDTILFDSFIVGLTLSVFTISILVLIRDYDKIPPLEDDSQ